MVYLDICYFITLSGKKIHYLEEQRPYRPGEGRFRAAVANKFKKMVNLMQDKLQGKEELLQEELSDVQAEIASLDTHACPLDGIIPPKLTGHFYAMSVYFYAIDCVRHHGHFKKNQRAGLARANSCAQDSASV